jgi:ADP-ribosylglycohydrolase
MSQPTILERFQGCLVGGAVGDALAKPAQFLPADEVAARYGRISEFDRSPDYLYLLLPEQWSDDTHMVLIHAQSLIAQGKLDMDDVARRYIVWRNGGDLRGMNMDLDLAIEGLKHGYPWQDVGRQGERAGSNNAATRVAPIGLLHYRDYASDPAALR